MGQIILTALSLANIWIPTSTLAALYQTCKYAKIFQFKLQHFHYQHIRAVYYRSKWLQYKKCKLPTYKVKNNRFRYKYYTKFIKTIGFIYEPNSKTQINCRIKYDEYDADYPESYYVIRQNGIVHHHDYKTFTPCLRCIKLYNDPGHFF